MNTSPEYRSLMDYALRLLGRRAYTIQAIRQKLEKRSMSPGAPQREPSQKVVVAVLKQLEALNLLNDQVYCARWVEERSRLRPRGRYGLMQELQRKGVPKAVVEQFWNSESGQQFNEKAMAKKVLSKQVSRLQKKYEGHGLRQRLYLHMVSRGFSHDVARNTLEAWEGDLDKVSS